MKLEYMQSGEYLIPNLTMEEVSGEIGKYGMMRRQYLEENRKGQYSAMRLTDQMNQHLVDTERRAEQRLDMLMSQLLEKDPPPDKKKDNLAWARHMNRLKSQAEEIVIQEIIYS